MLDLEVAEVLNELAVVAVLRDEDDEVREVKELALRADDVDE